MRILFIHQNFPGQFKLLAPALAARGHEVIALGINRPSVPTPGVRVVLHRPKFTAPAPGTETDADAAALQELRNTLASLRNVTRRLEENPTNYLLGREKMQEFQP